MTTDTIKITMDLLYRKYLIPMLLFDENGYLIKLGGLTHISVSTGEEVTAGQTIAQVNSGGTLTISFSYHGTSYNPYFYLDVGEGSLYGDVGDATGKAALLIGKAYSS